MSVEPFGRLADGTEVERVRLAGGGLTAQVLTYGAVVQDLRLDGHGPPLVLGLNDIDAYVRHSPYFGATAGRCANRIRGGHLEIDGAVFQLDRNFIGKHTLHGGSKSIGKRVWRLEAEGADSVTLAIDLADGEMGFPGNMTVRATLSLLPGATLDVRYEATTDRPTLCNIAHHSYFNLDGDATILGHQLQIDADRYTPVDAELIPTGETPDVAGTDFDFREARAIGPGSIARNIDHNFCLSEARGALRPVAALSSPTSGISMRISTTEPGLQVYDGANISVPVPGLGGARYGAHAGVALEPQVWPDAPHHPHFPACVLRPGETYRQQSRFAFSKDPS